MEKKSKELDCLRQAVTLLILAISADFCYPKGRKEDAPWQETKL